MPQEIETTVSGSASRKARSTGRVPFSGITLKGDGSLQKSHIIPRRDALAVLALTTFAAACSGAEQSMIKASNGMKNGLTIEEMLEQTPEGETRLFEAPIQGVTEERFFDAWFNHDYPMPIRWDVGVSFREVPRLGTRKSPPGSLWVLPEPDIIAKSKGSRLADFYSWEGGSLFLISHKLIEIIEQLDPGSLECRPVVIRARDGAVDYNLVMPKRNLEAVDLERTDVLIKAEQLGEYWVKRVQFPNVVVFQKPKLADFHNFSDKDAVGWFWSRELIEAAEDANVRGARFKAAGNSVKLDTYRL